MNLLELLCDIKITKEVPENTDCDFWSVTKNNEIILATVRDSIEWIPNYELDKIDIFERLFDRILDRDGDCLVYEDELKKYLDTEVVFETEVDATSTQKYPLVCVRGACGGNCNGDCDCYCFSQKPCFNNRPDWNCWSSKYPEFIDFLFDIVKWMQVCDIIDALVVMFQYTPTFYEPKLSFSYSTAIQISGKKITVVKDARKWYGLYNRKYPTSDREIEESINMDFPDNYNYRFRF